MPKIEKKTQKRITAVAGSAALAIFLFGYFTVGFTSALDDYFVAAFVVVLAPLAAVNYVNYRWQKGIDQNLPNLFRSIVQSQEVGMTLPQALEEAAKRDFGPLTPELKKMTVQMSWGYSLEEALAAFGKRVGTQLMQRILPLIIEASHSGGNVEKVFDPMGKFIQSNNLMEKERKAQTRPYILIIYIALVVFLFTIVLLFNTFFATAQGGSLMGSSITEPAEMQRTFLHLTLVQGFFGGLAAGKMGEGSVGAGLKHSLIMMLLGYAALKLFM
ncbi:MAG: type II secretion system F family protein [Candidatus Bathyarchaeota archaeon]|nr:type II secretion system F family protein [Candidatus Bathyarchaeota archaeon]